MYVTSAEFYDELYHFKDYKVEAGKLAEIVHALHPAARTLLDVACSTGRHLEHLKDLFDVEGMDINEKLLTVARTRLPSVPLHQNDMIDFNLNRKFDLVTCLFASIAYVRTMENLGRTIISLARHLNPEGLMFVEPWLTPEQYWRNHIVMNISENPERKIVWMYVGEEKERVVTNNIHYMVGTRDGVSHFIETHQMGLFRHDDYLAAIAAAGLSLLRYDPKGFYGYGLYVARQER